ncbi:transcriptional repressor [Proteiniborus sp.]|uniref:Fur family transcriptional regulator n=1 Tax=Proteiniborus sp. TaxID=2079015 RepID=UPI0033339247
MDRELVPFKKIIERNGNIFTLQKQIILKIILESKEHLNAKEIYKIVKDKNIGLATVYRNLKEFHELGILKELNVNGISYYEMKIYSRKPLHIHLKCYKCDNIIDIDSRGLNLEYLKLNKIIEEKNNIEISDIDIIFIGLCSECKEEGKWRDQ